MFTPTLKRIPYTFCGQACYLQEMTMAKREEWEQRAIASITAKDATGFRSYVVSISLVNEDGSPLATEQQIQAEASCAEVIRAKEEIERINGFSKQAIDDVEKNLEATISDSSVTD